MIDSFDVPRDEGERANREGARSVLEDLLADRSDEFRARVLNTVVRLNLGANDPSFLFAVALGQLEVLLEDSPASMSRLFNGWTAELRKTLDLAETTLIQQQKGAIAQAAKELIKRQERVESRRFFTAIVPAAGILLGALGLGVLAGITVPPYLQGGFAPDSPVRLTREQAEALAWASGKEGKFARKMMAWNAGYLNDLSCLEQAKALGVQLTMGTRTARSGFCVVWVQPPGQRKFVEGE